MKAPLRETSTDYRNPYRPAAVAALNGVGRWLARVGIDGPRLEPDALIGAARRGTGLHELGDPAFREPLDRLVESIEAEAELHTLGRLITRSRLVGTLSNRLRAEAEIHSEPGVSEQRVDDPIVIAGLQRTGTTLLHRLLAADPGLRTLASWEAINPARLPRRPWHRRDPRIAKARLAEHSLRYLAPDSFAVHPVEAGAPEEDVLLLDYAFLSTSAEAILQLPTFAAWLEQQDQTPAYAYMKRLLQLLRWQRPADRWVLKSPHHLEWLDTLLAVFPRARIIQTHRDPVRTLASFCSMVAHIRGLFSDRVDPDQIGKQWSRKTARLLDRAMATRDRVGAETFIDVSYYDLVADPLAQIEHIYQQLDRPLPAATREAMRQALGRNRQHKHGRHVYRLADFGLTGAAVEPSLARYRDRFGVRHE